MAPFLIVGAVLLYLLLGGVTIGVSEYLFQEPVGTRDPWEPLGALIFWPLLAALLLVYFFCEMLPAFMNNRDRR